MESSALLFITNCDHNQETTAPPNLFLGVLTRNFLESRITWLNINNTMKANCIDILFLYVFISQPLRSSSESSIQITGRNLDLFSYRQTEFSSVSEDGVNEFGPEDWELVQCPDVEICVSRFDASNSNKRVDNSILTI